MDRPSAREMIERLGLAPLPGEGGYFRRVYQSAREVVAGPRRRLAMTSIYYLVTPDEFSALHRLLHDEIFHFYAGDPVELMQWRGGSATPERYVLGPDWTAGHRWQHAVEGGVWQGTKLVAGGEWALLGCTCGPGFEYEDNELATASVVEGVDALKGFVRR